MCRDELNRPENKGLKPVVDKLRSIKDKIDEGSKKYGEGLPRKQVRIVSCSTRSVLSQTVVCYASSSSSRSKSQRH